MCIRDRLQTLQEQISQQQTKNEEMQRILSGDSDEVTEWVARDSYNYAAANERIPVSYTHLRAHETDSYLVCRLLLEKKKTQEKKKQKTIKKNK